MNEAVEVVQLLRNEMTFAERNPALVHSYEELIKRIRHTGTVIVTRPDGKWYHSGDPGVVKERIKKIKSIIDDTYVGQFENEESKQFDHFLREGDK